MNELLSTFKLLILLGLVCVFSSKLIAEEDAKTEQERGEKKDAVQIKKKSSKWESSVKSNPNMAQDVTEAVQVKEISEPKSEYSFSAFGKADPFIPPLLSSLYNTVEIPIINSLQKFRVPQLKVVGIWKLHNGDLKALITTPSDEGIVVAVGDPVGTKGGKVVKIEDQEVVVREFTMARDGTRQFEDIALTLGGKESIPKSENKIMIRTLKKQKGTMFGGMTNPGYLENSEDDRKRQEILLKKLSEDLTPADKKSGDKPEEERSLDLDNKSTNPATAVEQQINDGIQKNKSMIEKINDTFKNNKMNKKLNDATEIPQE